MKPKFVIGIGSQRAGSTLLHKILQECTEIFMHPVKELHYYDTLFNVRDASVLNKFSARQVENIIENENFTKRQICNLRTNKILATTSIEKINYIDLYRPCILGKKYLGEITPEYMILPEEGIQKMRDDLGENTKIILIARDPVERFISSFKLLKLYENREYDMKNFQKDLEETMISMPSWIKQQNELNDYETALNKYKKYFKNVLFMRYEQIITDKDTFYKELKMFLDIEINKKKFDKILASKVNAIGETGNISDNIKEQLKVKYKNELDFLKNYKETINHA